jgi:hypothetical protein
VFVVALHVARAPAAATPRLGFKETTKAFLDDMKLAAEGTAKFVHGLAAAARWLGVSSAEAAVNPTSPTGADSGGTGASSPGANAGDGGSSGGAGGGGSGRSRGGRSPGARGGGSSGGHGGGRTGRTIGGHEGSFPVHGDVGFAMRIAKDQLRQEGVPEEHLDAAAAALVGNAIAESSLNHRAVHDSGTGYGIYGAGHGRRTKMFAWLAANGYAKDSFEGQQRYMAHEAMHDYPVSRRALMNATDPSVAGDVLERNFEAPKVNNNRHLAFHRAYSARNAGSAHKAVDTEYGPQLPDHVVTHKKKVSIRSVPGSDVFAQSMSTRWGLV